MSTRRPPLTRERIIEAALHLIDAQGLRRLTMRRLGDALEVEAMAIYHHLPRGKEQLLDALVGHVAAVPATRPAAAPPAPDGAAGADAGAADGTEAEARTSAGADGDDGDTGPHERLTAWAYAYRVRLVAHSGVLPLLLTRRNSSALATTTASVRDVLTGAGAAGDSATATAHALLAYIVGHCAVEIRDRLPQADGEDPVDWDARFQGGLDLVLAATPR
jgi:TetR/AcrR family transcriptional regulator, tetracycline repressor protein